jgi:hypothetical protein
MTKQRRGLLDRIYANENACIDAAGRHARHVPTTIPPAELRALTERGLTPNSFRRFEHDDAVTTLCRLAAAVDERAAAAALGHARPRWRALLPAMALGTAVPDHTFPAGAGSRVCDVCSSSTSPRSTRPWRGGSAPGPDRRCRATCATTSWRWRLLPSVADARSGRRVDPARDPRRDPIAATGQASGTVNPSSLRIGGTGAGPASSSTGRGRVEHHGIDRVCASRPAVGRAALPARCDPDGDRSSAVQTWRLLSRVYASPGHAGLGSPAWRQVPPGPNPRGRKVREVVSDRGWDVRSRGERRP